MIRQPNHMTEFYQKTEYWAYFIYTYHIQTESAIYAIVPWFVTGMTGYILVIFDIRLYGFFGLLVFYLFGRSVSFSLIQFSIYWILRIRFNGPAWKISLFLGKIVGYLQMECISRQACAYLHNIMQDAYK